MMVAVIMLKAGTSMWVLIAAVNVMLLLMLWCHWGRPS